MKRCLICSDSLAKSVKGLYWKLGTRGRPISISLKLLHRRSEDCKKVRATAMGKTVWIINHYAGAMFFNKGGRHYWLAKYLHQAGYQPVVFCANMQHGKANERHIDTEDLWVVKGAEEIHTPFVYVKARKYQGNGKQRVLNMVDFYRNVKKAAVEFAKKNAKPDIIYASSVHPLALVAGIQLAKKFGVKCICEVRDLWPESIVAYSSKWTRTNPLMRILYAGEKWIYQKADYVIMTWPGGYDYIREQGWEKKIPESKVVHISNGVDLEPYIDNLHKYPYEDPDLGRSDRKSFVYAGSIRKVDNLGLLVSAAEQLKQKGNASVMIVVFGDGDELQTLEKEAQEKKLDNIVFKGRVPKQNIPSILSQSYATILHNTSTVLDKYGQSQNKFFEYLAAGHPILMTYSVGHSVIRAHGCGIEIDDQTPEAIADAMINLCELSEEQYQQYCKSAAECAEMFDYKELSKQLTHVLNKCV